MIFKNLLRRKGRTFLTLVGIAIGVAAIVALGAVAGGMRAGFTTMTRGSQADLVITQADALSAMLGSFDQRVAEELSNWREVSAADGVLFGNTLTDDGSYLFFFGYDPEGFAVRHFRVVEGQTLAEAQDVRGSPLILGKRAADSFDKRVGDTFHVSGTAFRIVGLYETGSGFEDSGAVLPLQDAQTITLQPRHVSMIYIKLREPAYEAQLRRKVERQFPNLSLSTTTGFAEQEQMLEILEIGAMAIAGLAILIGGVGMTNTLFMSVFERTREIGLLRSLGWGRWRVLFLVLGESLALALLGGLVGIGLGVGAVFAINRSSSMLGMFGSQFTPGIFVRALVTVTSLGLVGGAYPAWWASRLLPIEALRYEGGAGMNITRALPGGMTLRNLVRRRTRTALTLLGIGISIAAIVALGALAEGMADLMTGMFRASQTDLFAIEAGVDADFSAIEERVGSRMAAWPEVEAVAGTIMTAVNADEMQMLIVFGYHPRSFAIRHFRIIEGEALTGRHQTIVGKQAAEQMGLSVGDTLRLLKSNFRVVGIYETGISYEDIGVVIGLREAQALTGKPHQVMYYAIKLRRPEQAEAVKQQLEAAFPGLDISLTSEIAESMSDFQVMEQLMTQVSILALFVGGLGMLNTMLMSVLERTREIGVLRALGWRRRRVLAMILRESLLLGTVGGICGIILGLALGRLIGLAEGMWGSLELSYTPGIFAQAVLVALIAGVAGGLYPAWRATRMRPVEALRYE
ncbi:MAG: ABC transporter permease [Anaerolineae bacterium]|jgi:ABC-type antimicrobial peptide transport system permease subunit